MTNVVETINNVKRLHFLRCRRCERHKQGDGDESPPHKNTPVRLPSTVVSESIDLAVAEIKF